MLRTRSGLPKHITYEVDRYGKRRPRFRRRDVSVYLTGIPWSEEFMRQYAEALEADRNSRPKSVLRGPYRVVLALFVAYAEALKRSHQSSSADRRAAWHPSAIPRQSTVTGSIKDLQRVQSRGSWRKRPKRQARIGEQLAQGVAHHPGFRDQPGDHHQ